MSNQKILYITTEMSPYEEGTKMAGIVNKMAIKMHQNGNDVRVLALLVRENFSYMRLFVFLV